MWGWLKKLLMQVTESDEDLTRELLEAQAARRQAEAKLYQTNMMEAEVRGVAAWARSLRRENHFSARITEALGRISDD